MPLTRKHFELGIDATVEEWMRKTYAFLTSHKDQAFTKTELEEALLPKPRTMPQLTDFQLALDKLLKLRAVEEREVKGNYYLSYGPEPLEQFLG